MAVKGSPSFYRDGISIWTWLRELPLELLDIDLSLWRQDPGDILKYRPSVNESNSEARQETT